MAKKKATDEKSPEAAAAKPAAVNGDAKAAKEGAATREKAEAAREAAANASPSHAFYIAPGKSLTSRRGLLNEGDEVKQGDLPKDSFDGHLKRGTILKGK